MFGDRFNVGNVCKIDNQEINQRSLTYINDKTKNKTELSHYSFSDLYHAY